MDETNTQQVIMKHAKLYSLLREFKKGKDLSHQESSTIDDTMEMVRITATQLFSDNFAEIAERMK